MQQLKKHVLPNLTRHQPPLKEALNTSKGDKRLELNTVRAACGGYLSKPPTVARAKRSLGLAQDIWGRN